MKHPTPFYVKKHRITWGRDELNAEDMWLVHDALNNEVARCWNKEDADRIVAHENAHDALVAALDHLHHERCFLPDTCGECEKAAEVLAAAKG